MKKTMIALALASAMGTAAADVTVYGSVEQALTHTDNGTTTNWDVTADAPNNYIGFKSSEDLGNGLRAFADVSLNIVSESSTAATTKNAHVGIEGGFGKVAVGRMLGVQQRVGDATIDIMEGNSIDVTNSDMVSNTVAYTTPDVNGLSASVAIIADGATGQQNTDTLAYSVGYSNGPVSAVYSYQDDKVNNDQTTIYGATVSFGDLSVGGAFETVENNDGTADVDTTSVVAAYALGNNVVKVAAQRPDEGNDVNIAELEHKFSKNTNAYVNYMQSSPVTGAADTDTFQVGMRMTF
jgi:predicted porin